MSELLLRSPALDRLDLLVVVDNETDSLSSVGTQIPQAPETLGHLGRIEPTVGRGGHQCYEVFDHLCVACHGFSVLATAQGGDERHRILFDVGPYGDVVTHAAAHVVGGGLVLAGGEIARVTDYETGLAGHHSTRDGELVADPLILDERYLAAEVAGRGVTILSACAHAGMVNACLDASAAFPGSAVDLVLGGYHLAGPGMEDRIGDRSTYALNEVG